MRLWLAGNSHTWTSLLRKHSADHMVDEHSIFTEGSNITVSVRENRHNEWILTREGKNARKLRWILIFLIVWGQESEERVNANSVLVSVIRAFEMPDTRSLRKQAVSWVRSLECWSQTDAVLKLSIHQPSCGATLRCAREERSAILGS